MTNEEIELLQTQYLLGENLAPDKPQAIFVAYTDSPDISFVIKELDTNHAAIYRKLMQIWNPYIAEVYDVLTLGETHAAITEHIFGLSLSEYIKQIHTLDTASALKLCIQLCDALISVHKAGIIHKDITPNNILITADGSIKLIDFGIARELSPDSHNDTEILGTRGFVAPEVRSAFPSSYTADLYSVGCILNYMLTGAEPGVIRYTGDSGIETILNHTICLDPNDRYRSAYKLKTALEHELRRISGKYIPFIHLIPGFRSGTPWKMLLAVTIYGYFFYFNIYEYFYEDFNTMLILDIFWFILPVFITSSKILPKILPHRLTGDRYNYNLFRFIAVALSVFFGYWMVLKLSGWHQ